MKRINTFFLILVLLILISVKLFINKFTPLVKEPNTDYGKDLSLVYYSNIQDNKTYHLNKNSKGDYSLSVLYIVFYDKQSKTLVSSLEEAFQNRLEMFDQFMFSESLGRINSSSKLIFSDIREFGSKSLSYDKNIFDWITSFYSKFDQNDYDVLVFVPIYEVPWCNDGLSQGFNYNGKIFFCMESFFNPANYFENVGAVGLMTHKILHGVGFNHQNQLYKQYQFIDWQMGLPETNILLHGNYREFDHPFFDEHTLKILGVINKTVFEEGCPDSEGFVCKSKNRFFCEDSWGPSCQDIDKDGIIDAEDEYVFSSPLSGDDSDGDGIVDSLDLCSWNNIEVTGNNILPGPLKLKASGSPARVVFSGDVVLLDKIKITPFEMIGGFIKFDDKKSIVRNGNEIIISNSESPLWRIQVFYEYDGKSYFRPYYLYFSGFDADFFYEKEWYYFTRFGCDVPEDVFFARPSSYDTNLDGLPDSFDWSNSIDESYDWDNDGIPDLEDTLPTIAGTCSNVFVTGVKDTDYDGFCDPGSFDFEHGSFIESYEIAMIADYNEFSDLCPYISGRNRGCP